jgi:hypothetical protein
LKPLVPEQVLKPFERNFLSPDRNATYVGGGSLGGKATGLALMQGLLAHDADGRAIEVRVPAFTVLRTDVFDDFIRLNHLSGLIESEAPDDVIAQAFQAAALPAQILGDLRSIVEQVRTPLAVRSSSLLEDSLHAPFAGVYETKMIPNNQKSVDERFRKLSEAIKFVYSSTFFRGARDFLAVAGKSPGSEKMAVVIQEVVGERFQDRFYPVISGVARSFNFYSFGRIRPEEGIVSLALGLGKTIVDGGRCWTYSPAHPALAPPYSTPEDLIDNTQREFWAVNMGKPPAYDPIRETEYLVREGLAVAEEDGTLRLTASTYDHQSNKISLGTGSQGQRVLNFALLLRTDEFGLNSTVKKLLALSEESFGSPVEIEFAVTMNPARIGFLQVRPLMVTSEEVSVSEEEWNGDLVLARTERALGNGIYDSIRDIVYVVPGKFDRRHTRRIAVEVDFANRVLVKESRPYLLIGFGRWGSSDPWLGVPVIWSQVSGARAIIESGFEEMSIDMSQGSHFFHNLMSFRACYLSVPEHGAGGVRWSFMEDRTAEWEGEFVRHVRLPVQLKVDGRTGRGVVMLHRGEGP